MCKKWSNNSQCVGPRRTLQTFNKACSISETSHASSRKSSKLIPMIQFLYETYGISEILLEFHLVENKIWYYFGWYYRLKQKSNIEKQIIYYGMIMWIEYLWRTGS